MFTIAAAGSSSLFVSRPTASSGTITTAANAYDLPSSRPDDPPYTTSADRALVTGSAVAGTPDYATVEYNTFTARSKTNFSQCQLVIGSSSLLNHVAISSYTNPVNGSVSTSLVTSSLSIDYQIDGTNWVNIKLYGGYGVSANSAFDDAHRTAGDIVPITTTKETLSVTIPSSSFPSNLSSLKVRFVLGTCKNSTVTTYQSSGSYQIWDIRANIS